MERASSADGGQPADGHQALDGEGIQREHGRDRRRDVGRREAGLGRVEVDVDLEQDRIARARPDLAGQPVQPLGEVNGVDGLDPVEALDRLACLVRLERTDQLPAGAGHVGGLGEGLLDAVLAQIDQPGRDGGPQPLGRDGLGDGDQVDRIGVAAHAGARRRDAGEDGGPRGREARDLRDLDPSSCVGRPAAGRGHLLRRRKLGISRSSASYVVGFGAGAPTLRSTRGVTATAAASSVRDGLVNGVSSTSSRWRCSSSRKSRSRGARMLGRGCP